MDVADGYVTFVRHSQDMLREKVNEEVYIERLFDVSKPYQLVLHPREEQKTAYVCIFSVGFFLPRPQSFVLEGSSKVPFVLFSLEDLAIIKV